MLKVCEICGKTNENYNIINSKRFGMTLCNKHRLQMYSHGKTREITKKDKNEIIIHDNYAEICLYRNNEIIGKTKIDIDDIDVCKDYKWFINGDGYAYANDKKGSTISLSRYLYKDIDKSMEIDHIDNDRLNNCKNNLRMATRSQNNYNKKSTGITWNKKAKKWYAQIGFNCKKLHIGSFDNPDEAYNAYCIKAGELFGEFANIKIKDKILCV
jgi:hypothetical protein